MILQTIRTKLPSEHHPHALQFRPAEANPRPREEEKLPIRPLLDSSPSTATSLIEFTVEKKKTKTTKKRHWNRSVLRPTSVREASTPWPRVPPHRTSDVTNHFPPPPPPRQALRNEPPTGWQPSAIETSSWNPSKWITTKSERSLTWPTANPLPLRPPIASSTSATVES